MGMTNEQRTAAARLRKARVLDYITQDPPVPLPHIMQMEGMSERPLRAMIRELETEHGVKYTTTAGAKKGDLPAFGLSEATSRLRSRLARELYRLTAPENEFNLDGRMQVAPMTGLNPREQIRAEEAPWGHDWTLSQIERLARSLGEDPREFMLKCLTT